MIKTFKIFLNIIVVALVGLTGYQLYLNSLNSELDVNCNSEYTVTTNIIDISCEVIDSDSIISQDHPLVISLYNESDVLIDSFNLSSGINSTTFDSLSYDTLYSIVVSGYDFNDDTYIKNDYYTNIFSTVIEDINIPSISTTELSIEDTTYQFNFAVTDLDNLTNNVEILLYNSSNTLVATSTFTDFSDVTVLFEDLTQLSDYKAVIILDYEINSYGETASLQTELLFTTLKTLYIPTASINAVTNNNITLAFTLATNDKDATDVTYTVSLVDQLNNILYTSIHTAGLIEIDITEITGYYDIVVSADYTFEESIVINDTLSVFNVYNNFYANFFAINNLEIVDTSQDLTSYADYQNYIYTYFNEGETEFTINCDSSIDCENLVTNSTYSSMPFKIIDLVHSYSDILNIQYSYNSSEVTITVEQTYTEQNISDVNDEIISILNSIINDSMTDYDKILAVHDYVVNNTVYDEGCLDNQATCDNDHTAIGVLFDTNAVCEGYAHTIDIMLRVLRIPTFKISSDTHQWNAVYYDGGWYHLDATWDDPVTSNGTDVLRHDYFLIDTATLNSLDTSTSHTYSTTFINFME